MFPSVAKHAKLHGPTEVGCGSIGKDLAQEPGHAAVAGLAHWKFDEICCFPKQGTPDQEIRVNISLCRGIRFQMFFFIPALTPTHVRNPHDV